MQTGQMIFTSTEQVVFGKPAAESVLEIAEAQDAKNVFILASHFLRNNTEEIANIEKALGSRHAATWSGIPPHAPRKSVIEATRAARNANIDLMITVGGGSVTDAGKIITLLLKHGVDKPEDMERLRVYVTEDGQVVNPIAGDPDAGPDVRTVCIPTTLSGGEFNALSGATDEVSQHKQGYEHRNKAPKAVILDPAITIHTPEWLWLSTGVRAVDHAIETLASHLSNDFADGLADNALRLLGEGLQRTKADPSDLEGRLKCQMGAWSSMLPIIGGVPMGASHAIGHILGGTCDVPHGYTSCVMTPYVLAWNAEHDDSRQKRIVEALNAEGKTASVAADELIRSLGMPRTLTEVNVGSDRFDQVANLTLEDIWGRTNPRPVTGASDIMSILKLAA
tara:strand:- start:14586 stop:15767 length:1182 start_codon:yes stop_codon:yes gene_type:complete